MKYVSYSVLAVAAVFAGIYFYRDNFAEAILGGLLISLFLIFSMQFWNYQTMLKGRYRLFLLFGSIVFIAGTFSANLQYYKSANFQKRSLLETRAIIGESLLREKLSRIGVTLLDEYTSTGRVNAVRLDSLSRNFFHTNAALPFLVEPLLDGKQDKLKAIGGVYLTHVSADTLVLTGIDTVGIGTKKEFKNILKQVGKVQAKIILTPAGLRYQAEN